MDRQAVVPSTLQLLRTQKVRAEALVQSKASKVPASRYLSFDRRFLVGIARVSPGIDLLFYIARTQVLCSSTKLSRQEVRFQGI